MYDYNYISQESWDEFIKWFEAYSIYRPVNEEWLKREVETQQSIFGTRVFIMYSKWSLDGQEHEYYDL